MLFYQADVRVRNRPSRFLAVRVAHGSVSLGVVAEYPRNERAILETVGAMRTSARFRRFWPAWACCSHHSRRAGDAQPGKAHLRPVTSFAPWKMVEMGGSRVCDPERAQSSCSYIREH
jgi:hypothetical protein